MPDPVDKYGDKLDPRHKMAMDAIGFMHQVLSPHREQFETLVKATRDMHSIGVILDPTLYRDMLYSKSFDQQIRLARAALTFLRDVDAVKAELEPQKTE
jgi:hypothetical protein